MSTYELLFLYNIPFLSRVGDTTRTLYYYDAKQVGDNSEPIAIGIRNEDGTIRLDEGWQVRIQPRIDAWRSSIASSERGVVQPRAPKPSKPKRVSPKTTTATTTVTIDTTKTTNTVVYPPSPKVRPRGVRKNPKAVP